MELYLIRHGQSANNRSKAEQAVTASGQKRNAYADSAPRLADPPLTHFGEHQARLAAESLKDEGITRINCGPMLRTMQTAQIIGGILDLSPYVFVGLHEWGGVWERRGGTKYR